MVLSDMVPPPAYELCLVLKGHSTSQTAVGVLSKYGRLVLGESGIVRSIDNLGTRKLAYPIFAHQKKNLSGDYFVMRFDAPPTLVQEIDRQLRIDERIIRHLMVKDSVGSALRSASGVKEKSVSSSSSSSSGSDNKE